MWKNIVEEGQATDENMAHAHCVLDTKVYTHTLRICNTHCFPTATMVARTLLSVTLYVHCLSFSVSALFCLEDEDVAFDNHICTYRPNYTPLTLWRRNFLLNFSTSCI